MIKPKSHLKVKKILAKEILILLGTAFYTTIMFLAISYIESGFDYYWEEFNPFQTTNIKKVGNTYLLWFGVIIMYLLRPIVLLTRWSLKTLKEG